ncbi:MAG: tyrosine-type recombinase/integrase [Phenylobacterium sp.]|uniref:tyrosine-type recombinase/integrase n=1 Tax=Phenylobacterium sp. TaxID=1871053 RepID=UPI00391C63AC
MNLRQKPNGIWMVDYEDETGARRRVSTGLRDKAEAKKRAREIVMGIDVPPPPGAAPPKPGTSAAKGVTMREVFDLCCTHDGPWTPRAARSQATIKSTIKVLEPLIGAVPVREVSYARLCELQQELLGRGYAPGTVQRKMHMVGKALSWAVVKGLLHARPNMPKTLKVDSRKRVLLPHEEALIFDLIETRVAAEPQRPWTRFRHLIRYLLDTGCRLGEALATETTWIGQVQGGPAVTIPAHVTKTRKARTVPLTQRVVETLPFLRITSQGGKLFPMKKQTVWYMWDTIREDARLAHKVDLSDVVLHSLRHTCLTRLLQGGLPLERVSDWAGHADVKITAGIYGHLEVADLHVGTSILEGTAPARGLRVA